MLPRLPMIDDVLLGPAFKGFPLERAPFRVADTANQHLHLLRGDLPFPCAILRAKALDHNSRWYAALTRELEIDFAPHGKTTMAPQIFARQLRDGAWGITVGTVQQAWVAAQCGVKRILLANQIATPGEARRWLRMLEDDTDLRMISLLDSQAQLGLLEEALAGKKAEACALARPYSADGVPRPHREPVFEVLIELGRNGGRSGCRSVEDAFELAQLAAAIRGIRVVGVEAYEGLGATGDSASDAALVEQWMGGLEALLLRLERDGFWPAHQAPIVSAGGSSVFDLVADALVKARARALGSHGSGQRPWQIILRSGCYIAHDDGSYQRMQHAMEQRGLHRTIREGLRFSCCPAHARGSPQGGLQPALEVWAAVQSRPEPGLALVSMGRRDVGFDAGLPLPVLHVQRGEVRRAPGHWQVNGLNDQHGYLRIEPSDALQVGDLVGFGVSHPCTSFDKWRLIWVIDDAYNVMEAVCTYF